MPRRLLTGLGITVVAVGAVIGVLLFLQSREGATTGGADTTGAPGTPSAQVTSPDLRAGNVVLLAAPDQVRTARAVAEEVAGPADVALREAGQAVIVRRSSQPGVTAQAWQRQLQAPSADDDAVRSFIDYWLGRGAPSP